MVVGVWHVKSRHEIFVCGFVWLRATSKDDRKPDEPEEVPSGSEDDQGDGSDAEGGSDGNEGEGGEEKAGEGSGGEEGDAAAGGDDGGDDDGEEDEESFDEEEDDDDDDDDEDYDSEDGPGLAAIYESVRLEEACCPCFSWVSLAERPVFA